MREGELVGDCLILLVLNFIEVKSYTRVLVVWML